MTDYTHPLLIISGSNRPLSNTLKVARIIERHYQALSVSSEIYSLEELPPEVFSPQAYDHKPQAFQRVQQRVLAAAGLHVVTPEYNGSFPGVLKYFIDLLKFPESFENKPVAFVGLAAGSWGGLRAVEQLQLVFAYRNAHVFPDRVFLPSIAGKFDSEDTMNDASLEARLRRQATGFAHFSHVLRAAN